MKKEQKDLPTKESGRCYSGVPGFALTIAVVLGALLGHSPAVLAEASSSAEIKKAVDSAWGQLAFCGDGIPDPGEECDDGNQLSGDGCSATCQIEPIIECFPQPPAPGPVNVLSDGSFEDENSSGAWTLIEHSLFGPNLICYEDSCFSQPFAAAPDGTPTTGRYVLVAGGTFAGGSTGRVLHGPVEIPEDATTLEFQWATLASGPNGAPCADPGDGLTLLIGETAVWSSLDSGACQNVVPYQRVIVDLAAAPGGPYQGVTTSFEFLAVATGIPPSVDLTNIMLDDVSINRPSDDVAPEFDCELDGIPDASDNCRYIANPPQRDTDGDGHGNRCDADFNQDCIVNALDLGVLKGAFFSAAALADLDGDGVVNVIDLGILRSLFFESPGIGAPGALCNPWRAPDSSPVRAGSRGS